MSTWKAAQVDRLKPLVFLLGLFPLGRWVAGFQQWSERESRRVPDALQRGLGLGTVIADACLESCAASAGSARVGALAAYVGFVQFLLCRLAHAGLGLVGSLG